MIQRIQSVFLVLAAISMICLLAIPFPIAMLSGAPEGVSGLKLFADKVFNLQDHPILIGLSAAVAALSLINIMLFRNRVLQMRISFLIIGLCLTLIGVGIFLYTQELNILGASAKVLAPSIGYGIGAPVLTIVFLMLANRFIKKDETLVRDSNRLR